MYQSTIFSLLGCPVRSRWVGSNKKTHSINCNPEKRIHVRAKAKCESHCQPSRPLLTNVSNFINSYSINNLMPWHLTTKCLPLLPTQAVSTYPPKWPNLILLNIRAKKKSKTQALEPFTPDFKSWFTIHFLCDLEPVT